MENNKIPFLNQKLVLSTFFTIFRRNIWIVQLIIIFSMLAGFAYHRYTRPEYKTYTIIQIKTENKTNQILNINSGIMESEIAPVIELIRSNEFLKTVTEVLPFDVSYYVQGAISFTELYKSSPFEIDYRLTNSSILDQKINCEFVESGKCLLTYQIANNNYEYVIGTDEWVSIFGLDIYIRTISKELLYGGNNPYFFTVNNEKTVLKLIAENLNVQMLNESAGTIMITYIDHNANKSAEITNTIAEKFLEFDGNKKRESALNVLSYIDLQMENVFDQLNKIEKDLHDFRIENNILVTDENIISNKNQLINSKISELELKMINIDFEIFTLERVINKLNSGQDINTYEILAMVSGVPTGSAMTAIINSLQDLVSRRELLLFDITENTNKILVIDEQIRSKKEAITEYIKSTKNRLEEEKKEYSKRIKDYESQFFVEDNYDEIEYARLNRLYTINQNFYSQLMKTKAETMISQAGYITNNIILEKAVTPTKPSYPDLTKVLIISLIIGIIVADLYLFIKYLFYNKILTANDITEYTTIPVIGSVPRVKANMPVSRAVVQLRPKSLLSESFRNIRTNIEFYPVENKGRIITVSSTVAGEGKTFVALNIAAIFAMSDKKTIILDFDLRKPRIHKCFDTENIKGISTILIRKNTYQECLHKSDIENLDYITSGPLPPNPAEIILNDSLEELLSELRSVYDIIIIDTPPVGIVIDALVTYKLSDNAIYVMRSEISSRNYINNINNIAESNNIKNLTIVINDVAPVTTGYGYGSNYKYGYGYGYGYSRNEQSSYYDEEEDDNNKNFMRRIFNKFKK